MTTSTPPGRDTRGRPDAGGTSADAPRRNALGIAALVLSILAFLIACIPGASITAGVVLAGTLVFSIASLFLGGPGRGPGVAAVVISILGICVAAFIYYAIFTLSFATSYNADPPPRGGASGPLDPTGPEPEPEAEDVYVDAEARAGALALGDSIAGEGWSVTVDAHSAAADGAVAAGGDRNAPAPAEWHYESVAVTLTRTAETPGLPSEVVVTMVNDTGYVIDSGDSVAILEDAIGPGEIAPGASATGSVAFLLPNDARVLIGVRPGMHAERVLVSP